MNNMGLVMLVYLVAIFVLATCVSFGRLAKWFFAPHHLRWLQKFYWFCVIIAVITTVFEHI